MTTATAPRHDIAKPELAEKGKKRILWADQDMPVLQQVRADVDPVRRRAADRDRAQGAHAAAPVSCQRSASWVPRRTAASAAVQPSVSIDRSATSQ